MNAVKMSKTHINATEAAKLIRKALKVAFPGTKFSVRSEYFSMGSAVRVSFSNGPLTADVEAIATQFGERGFDGQTDCSYQCEPETMIMTNDGPVMYEFGGWVSVTRNFSDEVRAAYIERYRYAHAEEFAEGLAYVGGTYRTLEEAAVHALYQEAF